MTHACMRFLELASLKSSSKVYRMAVGLILESLIKAIIEMIKPYKEGSCGLYINSSWTGLT